MSEKAASANSADDYNACGSSMPSRLEFRPFDTDLVGPAAARDDDVVDAQLFGHTWQEKTFALGALVVTTSPTRRRLVAIEHIARRDLTRFLATDRTSVGGSTFIFQLLDGEFLRGLEVTWDATGVSGFCVDTGLRRSQWFGLSTGSIQAIDAPTGYFINALIGERRQIAQAEQVVTRLGACCCPLSLIHHATVAQCPRFRFSERCGAGLFDPIQLEFDDHHAELRAIIIKCDDRVERIWALSADEFECFRVVQARQPLGWKEHCLELVPGERIMEVGIHSHEVVNSLRLRTTRQKTPWYGTCRDGALRVLQCDESLSICGFHGTIAFRLGFSSNGDVVTLANLEKDEFQYLLDCAPNCITRNIEIFQLLPGEEVSDVDVDYSTANVHAIRIRTNKRSSPWFGTPRKASTRTFSAPEDGHIHALWGVCGATRMRQLGAVYAVMPVAGGGHPNTLHVGEIKADSHACLLPSWIFCEYREQLRAIVLRCSTVVQHIWALSASEYDLFVENEEQFTKDPEEHRFILSEGEILLGVGVAVLSSVIKKIRFKTNFRTTPWYGDHTTVPEVWLNASDDGPGAIICGLRGRFRRESPGTRDRDLEPSA